MQPRTGAPKRRRERGSTSTGTGAGVHVREHAWACARARAYALVRDQVHGILHQQVLGLLKGCNRRRRRPMVGKRVRGYSRVVTIAGEGQGLARELVALVGNSLPTH